MWQYFEKNISLGDDRVAKFINKNGHTIFSVYKTRHSYLAVSDWKFIENISIPFEDAKKRCSAEELKLSAHEFLVAQLKHGCELIEEKYNKQLELITEVCM
ncbi:MAG: hypothetical protein J6A59_15005 [Lachnospiraceae bacterium]|nr:hypothetical protein [Lachnospiraceae bacterium]